MARSQAAVVVKDLTQFVELLMRKLALDITANLVRAPGEGGTPVDTGWARANWIPSLGAGSDVLSGTREQAEAGSVSQGAQNAGLARIAGNYRLGMGAIVINNNVPYIVRLNEGSSRQAPKGFVQAAIAKAIVQDLPSALGLGR